MKKIKKMIAMLLAIVMLACCLSMSASAGFSTTRRINDPDRFTYEWEHTRHYYVGDVNIGKLVYGFDMDFTDEDYAWTMGYECGTTASINHLDNDVVVYSKSAIRATTNSYSKCEAAHNYDDVRYIIEFDATYANVSGITTENTTEKG